MVTDLASRRQFIAGMLAAGVAPVASWADAGGPRYLSAAARTDGAYVLCGIDAAHNLLFEIPLPARGHAAAAHPKRPEAVAFARRPGTFALVIDCASGEEIAQLTSPPGRHFYGHGVFSQNGEWLFTTENDYEAGIGRIAIWDASNGYARAGDMPSGGIGPHDIKRLPGTDTLVVANGGIATHPDSGRTKLNIPTMAPNLSYCIDGTVFETATFATESHKNSIRHLAIAPDGMVAMGMQWQGDGIPSAMVAIHRQGDMRPTPLTAPTAALRDLNGYIGSIAFDPADGAIFATSPRGGVVHRYAREGMLTDAYVFPDACGVAPAVSGVLISTGAGQLIALGHDTAESRLAHLRWDNHLVSLV